MNDLFYLTEEHRMIRDLARKVARDRIAPNAAQYDESESYPTESMRALVDSGLFGIWVPEEHGGAQGGPLHPERVEAMVLPRRSRRRDHGLHDGRSGPARQGHHGLPHREGHAGVLGRQEREEDGHPLLAHRGAPLHGLRRAGRAAAR